MEGPCTETSMRLPSLAATPPRSCRGGMRRNGRVRLLRDTHGPARVVLARFFTRPLSLHAALWRPRSQGH